MWRWRWRCACRLGWHRCGQGAWHWAGCSTRGQASPHSAAAPFCCRQAGRQAGRRLGVCKGMVRARSGVWGVGCGRTACGTLTDDRARRSATRAGHLSVRRDAFPHRQKTAPTDCKTSRGCAPWRRCVTEASPFADLCCNQQRVCSLASVRDRPALLQICPATNRRGFSTPLRRPTRTTAQNTRAHAHAHTEKWERADTGCLLPTTRADVCSNGSAPLHLWSPFLLSPSVLPFDTEALLTLCSLMHWLATNHQLLCD